MSYPHGQCLTDDKYGRSDQLCSDGWDAVLEETEKYCGCAGHCDPEKSCDCHEHSGSLLYIGTFFGLNIEMIVTKVIH